MNTVAYSACVLKEIPGHEVSTKAHCSIHAYKEGNSRPCLGTTSRLSAVGSGQRTKMSFRLLVKRPQAVGFSALVESGVTPGTRGLGRKYV